MNGDLKVPMPATLRQKLLDVAKRRGMSLNELLEEAARLITEQYSTKKNEPNIH